MRFRECPGCGEVHVDAGEAVRQCTCGFCRHGTVTSYVCNDCGAVDPDHVFLDPDHDHAQVHDMDSIETPETQRKHEILSALETISDDHPAKSAIRDALSFDETKIKAEKKKVKVAIAARKRRKRATS